MKQFVIAAALSRWPPPRRTPPWTPPRHRRLPTRTPAWAAIKGGQELVGPSYKDVAAKYKGDKGALAKFAGQAEERRFRRLGPGADAGECRRQRRRYQDGSGGSWPARRPSKPHLVSRAARQRRRPVLFPADPEAAGSTSTGVGSRASTGQTMNKKRREVLRVSAVLSLMAATGLISEAQAAEWNKTAFDGKSVADVIKALGGSGTEKSGAITFNAPDIAENGAVVPVAVTSTLPDTEQIAILVEKNPGIRWRPISPSRPAPSRSSPRAREEMGQTSVVHAAVRGWRQVVRGIEGNQGHAGRLRRLTPAPPSDRFPYSSRANRTTPSRRSQMADPMRVRATENGGVVDVKILMKHDMETGQRKDAAGKTIPARHIQTVIARTRGARCSTPSSARPCRRTPFLNFKFKGGAKGDKVTVTWVDNRGRQAHRRGHHRLSARAKRGSSIRRAFIRATAALAAIGLSAKAARNRRRPRPRRSKGGRVRWWCTSCPRASTRPCARMANLRNHLNAAPDTKIVVVAFGYGVDFLVEGAKDSRGNTFEAAVGALGSSGVEFRVCRNTLTARKISEQSLLMDAKIVQAGVVEIARLQFDEGYAYLKP